MNGVCFDLLNLESSTVMSENTTVIFCSYSA